VLVNNLLYDFSQIAIPTDDVDKDWLEKPRKWSIDNLRRFIIIIGPISSIFDLTTYAVMLYVFNAWGNQALFQTGWFVESVISASLIVLVIRSRRPFFRSKPGKYLVLATVAVAVVVLVLPFTSLGRLFGFASLPVSFLLFLFGVVACYVLLAEIAKTFFYRWVRA